MKLAVIDLPEEGGLVEITTSSRAIRFDGECKGELSCFIPGSTDLLNFTIIIDDPEMSPQTVDFTVTALGVPDPDPRHYTRQVLVGDGA